MGILSHPTRVRGLKREIVIARLYASLSHPTRVRGLKPLGIDQIATLYSVAPHAGAWIETS